MNIEHVCIYTSGNELDIKSLISAFQTIINVRVIASSERRSLSGSYEDISAV